MHLTARELDVMAALWRCHSGTVTEVRETVGEGLAYTTVLTVLRGLEAKGAVRHHQEGKAYRYYPRIRPAAVGDQSLKRLIDTFYQGSRELLVRRLLADPSISPEELKRIRRLVSERFKGDRGVIDRPSIGRRRVDIRTRRAV